MTDALDLFTPTERPMHRRGDHATSVEAGERVRTVLSDLQRDVYIAIAAAGAAGLTDRELELLPQFAHLAPSTCRKRRSELLFATPPRIRAVRDDAGKVLTRNGLTVWVAL